MQRCAMPLRNDSFFVLRGVIVSTCLYRTDAMLSSQRAWWSGPCVFSFHVNRTGCEIVRFESLFKEIKNTYNGDNKHKWGPWISTNNPDWVVCIFFRLSLLLKNIFSHRFTNFSGPCFLRDGPIRKIPAQPSMEPNFSESEARDLAQDHALPRPKRFPSPLPPRMCFVLFCVVLPWLGGVVFWR